MSEYVLDPAHWPEMPPLHRAFLEHALPTFRADTRLTGLAAGGSFIIGMVAILALAAGSGIWLWHSRRVGTVVLLSLMALLALKHGALGFPAFFLSLGTPATALAAPASLTALGLFFFKVGALTFGGGSMMIALIQDQVVQQWHWLTPQEFLDGLALGQCTPGSADP